MTTTRRILMCLMVLLMTILMFASCGKDEYDVPPAIQRIIDNGGYEDKSLILIDEYSYNDDVVYLCLYSGYGWFSSSYYALPKPASSGSYYRYNVYAYYFPHTTSGTWKCEIRENGILSSSLLQKDISAYSTTNKGRTVMSIGSIQVDSSTSGVDIDLTANAAGSGGNCTLFLDALVFVRVQ